MKKHTSEELEFEKRNKAIGDRIRELRLKAGVDKPEIFAYKHDIGRTSYWRAEGGKTNLTLKILYKICAAHNISLAQFFEPLNDKFEKHD